MMLVERSTNRRAIVKDTMGKPKPDPQPKRDRPIVPMKPKEEDKKKTNPQPGRPLIPMKPQKPTGDVLKDIEKEFGPVKYAEPEKAKKDPLRGLTHDAGTKSLLKGMLKFLKP